jgi:hypothetical protein
MGISTFLIILLGSLFGCAKAPSDIRASVVKLASQHGACSGTQIKTHKGNKYILTAAHCLPIAVDGMFPVFTEDGGQYVSKIVEEDMESDLLLLEPAPSKVPALPIADDISRFETLTSFTHGRAYATYSTEGTFVGETMVHFLDHAIDTQEDRDSCKKKKNRIEEVSFFGMFTVEVCVVATVESVTTVRATPGSSGGIIANSRGELAGVVSTGDEMFTNLVTLKDIHRFLDLK